MKKLVLALAAAVILILAAPFLFPPEGAGKRREANLPWQIERFPDGSSRVFGLTLGESVLADAKARFGDGMQLAVVAAPGEAGAIEAFIDRAELGFVSGKLVLTPAAPPGTVAQMRERAVKAEYMGSDTAAKRFILSPSDEDAALRMPIASIALIPSIHLDEAMIVQRFGAPAERIRSSAQVEHLLYPDRGLEIRLDGEGKELLQYVAPRDFARLRAPLLR